MSPTPAAPGLVSRNQASRPDGPVTRLEASTEMAWPVGAVPRLTQRAGRAATDSCTAGAPGTRPGDASGGEAGDGAGWAAATRAVTLQLSSACPVAILTLG